MSSPQVQRLEQSAVHVPKSATMTKRKGIAEHSTPAKKQKHMTPPTTVKSSAAKSSQLQAEIEAANKERYPLLKKLEKPLNKMFETNPENGRKYKKLLTSLVDEGFLASGAEEEENKPSRSLAEVRKTANTSRNEVAGVDEVDHEVAEKFVSQDLDLENPFQASTFAAPKGMNKMKKLETQADIDDAETKLKLPNGQRLHVDEHDRELSCAYAVHPANVWNHLRRFKRFTVGDSTRVTAAIGDYIMVQGDDASASSEMEREKQWKGQVLEIRALDSEHVYIRVAWLYRPEDLPEGRKPYHGTNELVPSNEMDIIDAMTVNGKLSVERLGDDPDETLGDSYYWRQTFDTVKNKRSHLDRICTCHEPANPDEMIVQCGECEKWMHISCIAKDSVKKERKDTENELHPVELKLGVSEEDLDETSDAMHRSRNGKVAAYVRMKVAGDDQSETMVIRTANGQRKAHRVMCLLCHEPIA